MYETLMKENDWVSVVQWTPLSLDTGNGGSSQPGGFRFSLDPFFSRVSYTFMSLSSGHGLLWTPRNANGVLNTRLMNKSRPTLIYTVNTSVWSLSYGVLKLSVNDTRNRKSLLYTNFKLVETVFTGFYRVFFIFSLGFTGPFWLHWFIVTIWPWLGFPEIYWI